MGLATVEVGALRAIRRQTAHPVVIKVARGFGYFGEHSLGWIIIGTVGALAGGGAQWWAVTAASVVAHGIAVVVKRLVRRSRPEVPDLPPLCATPSALSFPSSHASSTSAAAIALLPIIGMPVALLIIGAMGFSRLLLGVHYPTDVLAGVAAGIPIGMAFSAVL